MDVTEKGQTPFLHKSLFSNWNKTEYLLLMIVSLYVCSTWLITRVYDRPEAFRGLLYVPLSGLVFFVVLVTYLITRIFWIMM